MSGVVLSGHKAGQTGLNKALVYEDGYLNWGWWCPDKNCSPDADNLTQQDGFKNRDNARRAAHRHEKEGGALMAWGDRAAEQHEKDQPTEVRIPEPEERKHSDAALIRAYALGHAHAKHRMTPVAQDWRCARTWYAEGDEPRESDDEVSHLAGWAPGNLQHHLVFEHKLSPSQVPYDGPLDATHAEMHRHDGPHGTPAEIVLDDAERRGD